jgi:hypothetical protein
VNVCGDEAGKNVALKGNFSAIRECGGEMMNFMVLNLKMSISQDLSLFHRTVSAKQPSTIK